jgi:hypothetical protein
MLSSGTNGGCRFSNLNACSSIPVGEPGLETEWPMRGQLWPKAERAPLPATRKPAIYFKK